MVETICGVLGGGPFAHHIRNWQDKDATKVANLVGRLLFLFFSYLLIVLFYFPLKGSNILCFGSQLLCYWI